MKKKLTEAWLKTVTQESAGATYVWDSSAGGTGFGVRLGAGGKKSFCLSYRIGGKKKLFTIALYPDLSIEAARQKAGELRVGIRQGVDPLEQRQARDNEPTFADLVDAYEKSDPFRKKRESTRKNDRGMLGAIIRPKLGKVRLSQLAQKDVADLHHSLAHVRYRANRVLALLSAIFSYGVEAKWLATNPAKGIAKYPEDKREAFLTLEQMQRLNEALDNYKDQSAADAIRLLMLTGAREMEVLKATWSQFDLERGTWTKPSSHTKQRRSHYVTLNPEALELLARIGPRMTGPVFPGKERKDKKGAVVISGASRTTLKRPWAAILKNAGLTEARMVTDKRTGKTVARNMPLYRIHDLRHNFASHLVSANESLITVGHLLGHTLPSTTMRYAHLQDARQREAANKFGAIFKRTQQRA